MGLFDKSLQDAEAALREYQKTGKQEDFTKAFTILNNHLDKWEEDLAAMKRLGGTASEYHNLILQTNARNRVRIQAGAIDVQRRNQMVNYTLEYIENAKNVEKDLEELAIKLAAKLRNLR